MRANKRERSRLVNAVWRFLPSIEDLIGPLALEEARSRQNRRIERMSPTARELRRAESKARNATAKRIRFQRDMRKLAIKEEKVSQEKDRIQAELDAKNVNVSVEDGSQDLLSAINWVLDNLPKLIIETPTGVSKIDEEFLKANAPSNKAVVFTKYARDCPSAFLEKFVTKLLPRDTSIKEAVVEEDNIKDVDPGFEGLEKYFLPKKGE